MAEITTRRDPAGPPDRRARPPSIRPIRSIRSIRSNRRPARPRRAAVATVATVVLALSLGVAAAGSAAALGDTRLDIPPPPSERSTTTTEPVTSPAPVPPTTARRSTTGDDAVSQAQLADVNQRLDRATSTATIALVLSVAALLLAAIGVVLARTGRRPPSTGG